MYAGPLAVGQVLVGYAVWGGGGVTPVSGVGAAVRDQRESNSDSDGDSNGGWGRGAGWVDGGSGGKVPVHDEQTVGDGDAGGGGGGGGGGGDDSDPPTALTGAAAAAARQDHLTHQVGCCR